MEEGKAAQLGEIRFGSDSLRANRSISSLNCLQLRMMHEIRSPLEKRTFEIKLDMTSRRATPLSATDAASTGPQHHDATSCDEILTRRGVERMDVLLCYKYQHMQPQTLPNCMQLYLNHVIPT